jgi:hypothetical protein
MKNIRILPTKGTGAVYISKDVTPNLYSNWRGEGHHIYITSKEYIGLSYYLDGDLVRKGVIDDKDYWEVRKDYEKIILTTDPKLIEDGVQGIDSEFVMWFINNPSCEFVKIGKEIWNDKTTSYKIIIPKEGMNCWSGKKGVEGWPGKEEPKQETLEDAKSNYADIHNEVYDIPCANLHINNRELIENAIEFGAKWQQEQDKNKYSEFNVKTLLVKLRHEILLNGDVDLEEWFEQFKKK